MVEIVQPPNRILRLDRSNRFGRSVVFASLPGQMPGTDLRTKQDPTVTSPTYTFGSYGAGVLYASTGGSVFTGLKPVPKTQDGFTSVVIAAPSAEARMNALLFLGDESGSPFTQSTLAANYDTSIDGVRSGYLSYFEYTGVFSAKRACAPGVIDGQPHIFILVRNPGAAAPDIYIDGMISTGASTVGGTVSLPAGVGVGSTNKLSNARSCAGPLYLAYVLDRAISASEVIELVRNAHQIFDLEQQVSVGVAGAGAALQGDAAATAAMAGALTTQIPLGGAALVVSSASAALTTQIPLAGSAAAIALADGVLITEIRLAGAAIAQALAAAGLNTEILLAAAASAHALAAAELTTQIQLDGAAVAQALAQGSLAGGAALAGNAQASAQATGNLTTQIPLAGDATAIAVAAGDLTTSVRLAGNIVGQAQATGNLTTQIPLAGAAAAVTSGNGALTVAIRLNAAALAQALATGDLITQIRLAGDAIAQASVSGTFGAYVFIPSPASATFRVPLERRAARVPHEARTLRMHYENRKLQIGRSHV